MIATGAGGGVMLQQLAEAGFRVVALQRGPELDTDRFSDDELEIIIRDHLFAADRLETYRLEEGEEARPGRYNQLAHAVGGSMTRWSGWSWRFREDDFRVLSTEGKLEGASLADWPVSYAELEPWYTRAEHDFGVAGRRGANPFAPPQGSEYPNPPHPARRSSRIFERGAAKLGYRPFPLPVAINPRARATGRLDLRANARVFELPLGPDGRVTGARYLDDLGHTHEVRARRVVVSCSAIGSPHLLFLSTSGSFPQGLANSSGGVGRNLMFHHHAAIRFLVDEPALGVTGIEAYRAIDDLHPSDPARGFIRGGVVAEVNAFTRQPIVYAFGSQGDPELTRPWGSELKRFLREFPRAITIGSVPEDLPMHENRVDLDPRVSDADGIAVARITHRQHPNDIAMNRWYADQLPALADACGATRWWPMDLPGITRIDAQTAVRGSAHVHGTCRMGTDPSKSVLDPWCRAHDVPDLWVVDGSCFPTAGGYNPTLTILANAYRVAHHLVEEARRQNL